MNKPHKHAALIHAWADGAEIEWRDTEYNTTWKLLDDSTWWDMKDTIEFRIKEYVISAGEGS